MAPLKQLKNRKLTKDCKTRGLVVIATLNISSHEYYQEYIILGRVSNTPIVACYITAYCLHQYTPLVYRNILFHTLTSININHKRGRSDHVFQNGCHGEVYELILGCKQVARLHSGKITSLAIYV